MVVDLIDALETTSDYYRTNLKQISPSCDAMDAVLRNKRRKQAKGAIHFFNCPLSVCPGPVVVGAKGERRMERKRRMKQIERKRGFELLPLNWTLGLLVSISNSKMKSTPPSGTKRN